MPAKRTAHKIRNPKTGRMVSRTGNVGRKVLASKKRTAKRKTRGAATRKKSAKRRKKPVTQRTVKKRSSKKGKYSGRGTVRAGSCLKVTRKGNVRLSARAFYNAGGRVGAVHCYGEGCKRLKIRKNGSPYWG